MTRSRCFLAAVLCLSLPTAALAMPPGSEPAGIEAAIVTAAAQADLATADELSAMGFGQTDAFTTHPVYRHDPRLDHRINFIATPAQPDAADAFEVRVDRAVQAAVERAIVPALRASAAADAASDAAPASIVSQGGTTFGLTFEQLVALLASVAVPLFLGIGGWLWKDAAKAKEQTIAKWVQAAYMITEEIAKLTPNKVDDKIAYALGVLTSHLQAAGITPTLAITEQAKATWTAMSGAEKVEASVRAKAVALAEQASAKTIAELATTGTASETSARPQTPPAA